MNELVNILLSEERSRMISGLALGKSKVAVVRHASIFLKPFNSASAKEMAIKMFESITPSEIEVAKEVFNNLKIKS